LPVIPLSILALVPATPFQEEWASTKAKGGDEVRRRLGERAGGREEGGKRGVRKVK